MAAAGIPVTAGAVAAPRANPAVKGRPDIILIITDQQTASAMSSAGCPYVKTPAMDSLAVDGVSFARAYCPFPLSNPSRASLMTGLMPIQTGVGGNGQGMKPEVAARNIGFVMGEAGYECFYEIGRAHV